MRWLAVLLLLVAGCTSGGGESRGPQEEACARQADDDPVVKDMLTKAAGNLEYQWQNSDKIRQAKQDATVRCLRARGLAPKGGVERRAPR